MENKSFVVKGAIHHIRSRGKAHVCTLNININLMGMFVAVDMMQNDIQRCIEERDI